MTTTVHILGSGTPTPTPDRFGSAFAIEIDGEIVMVDCGPATTWKLAKAGLRTTDVSTLFFTHHHFDHNVDYPCFVLTRWDQGSGTTADLSVLGPAPTAVITDRLIGEQGAFRSDIEARMNFSGSQAIWAHRGGALPRTAPVVNTRELSPGETHTGNGWTMRTGLARHVQPWLDSLAYRLETRDGSIVVTGDTEPCDEVVALAEDADLMLAMCWNTDEGQPNHRAGLSTLEDAVGMAAAARVGALALVHCGSNVAAPGVADAALDALEEPSYTGRVILTDELQRIDLSQRLLTTNS